MIESKKHKLISPLNIFILFTLISAGMYLIYAYKAGAAQTKDEPFTIE